MFVKINMNKLNSGKVRVAVYRAEQSAGPVREYPSAIEAKKVLLDFGIPADAIDSQLELLGDAGPQELFKFPAMEIADEVLRGHAFLL